MSNSQVPATTPDDLLDLAERQHRLDEPARAAATCDEFDERFGRGQLTLVQRARRADLHGMASANAGDLAVAEICWMSALDLYTEAGDELRRQVARSRIGQLMCGTDRAEIGVPIAQDATDYLTARAPARLIATAYRRMAFVYMLAGRIDEALANVAMAAAHAGDSDDPHAAARIAVDHAVMLGEVGRIDEAATMAARAREACRVSGYPAGLAVACWVAGRAAELTGQVDEALAAYDESLAEASAPDFIVEVKLARAVLLAGTHRAAEAVDDLLECLATALAADQPHAVSVARHQLAIAYLNSDRPLDAAEVAEEAIAGAPDDDPHVEPIRFLLAQAYRRLDLVDQAIEQLTEVAGSGVRRGDPALVGDATEQIGDILCGEDRDAAAAARFADAARAYREAELVMPLVRVSRRHAMSLMWAGHRERISDALADADLAALEMSGDDPAVVWERAMLACDGARIMESLGDVHGAIIRIGPSAPAFRRMGDVSAATFAAGIHGQLLLAAGRPAEAEQIIAAALEDVQADDVRVRLARTLVAALEAQERHDQAADIAERYGLLS